MTKKASIFKILKDYFRSHPGAVIGWVWVMIMPGIGSLVLLGHYNWLYSLSLDNSLHHLIFIVLAACVMGLALLPTTLTAVATGFYLGWVGLPDLLAAYLLANLLGYYLGSIINVDFLPLLAKRSPELVSQIRQREKKIGQLVFFIRVSPIIPFAISNFIFASLEVSVVKVVKYGIPGMLPRTLVAFATGMLASNFLAARESMNDPLQWLILISLLILSTWGIVRFWKIK